VRKKISLKLNLRENWGYKKAKGEKMQRFLLNFLIFIFARRKKTLHKRGERMNCGGLK